MKRPFIERRGVTVATTRAVEISASMFLEGGKSHRTLTIPHPQDLTGL